jgi:uncharacterized protein (TIGR03437 family)
MCAKQVIWSVSWIAVWLTVFSAVSFAQLPVISPNGIVNAASFSADAEQGLVIPPRSIATIFGQNLAAAPQLASQIPLPTELGGTSVIVNGVAAPLFYVSPSQVNFQVPSTGVSAADGMKSVVVRTGTGASNYVFAKSFDSNFGIFTQGSGRCGAGAIQNVGADGRLTLNTIAESVSPGSYVTLYGTGLGAVSFPPADGSPARLDSISPTQSSPIVLLGPEGFQQYATASFSALAPGVSRCKSGEHPDSARLSGRMPCASAACWFGKYEPGSDHQYSEGRRALPGFIYNADCVRKLEKEHYDWTGADRLLHHGSVFCFFPPSYGKPHLTSAS